jgi:phosphatidate cytidylyltransferase
VYLRHADASWPAWTGVAVVFFPLVIVWANDTVAMATGSLVGGRRLTPVLSPKKTWAGAIGGVLSGLVVGPVYGALALAPAGIVAGPVALAVTGAGIAVVAQVGDAAESLLKRDAGVKDSGTFFSGHGGVLDRFDALYWAIPAATAAFAVLGVV